MKLNRLEIFLIGFGVILAIFFLQRVYVYRNSAFTHGMMVCKDARDRQNYEADMILYYYIEGKEYSTEVREATENAYKELTVRYPKENLKKGRIYTTGRFWFLSMLWLLFPVMIWGAFVFTKFKENSRMEVVLEKK